MQEMILRRKDSRVHTGIIETETETSKKRITSVSMLGEKAGIKEGIRHVGKIKRIRVNPSDTQI
jgi:hypothetical protein